MTKVVYNTQFGGFGLSYAAVKLYAELKGIKLYPFKYTVNGKPEPITDANADKAWLIVWYTTPTHDNESHWSDRDISRTDPHLVQVVERLGSKAGGKHATLAIEELEPGTLYRIDEYDGNESVMRQSDYEWSVA